MYHLKRSTKRLISYEGLEDVCDAHDFQKKLLKQMISRLAVLVIPSSKALMEEINIL